MSSHDAISPERLKLLMRLMRTIKKIPEAWECQSLDDDDDEGELPAIEPDDDAIDEMHGNIWTVIDANGNRTAVTFAEMMVVIYTLDLWAKQEARLRTAVRRKRLRLFRKRLQDSAYIRRATRPKSVRRLLGRLSSVGRETDFRYDPNRQLTESQVAVIVKLLEAVPASKTPFKLHPPKIVSSDPSVLDADDAIDTLINTRWQIVFDHGVEEKIALVELLAFAFNLVHFQEKLKADPNLGGEIELPISHDTSVEHFMRADVALDLLRSLRPWMVDLG